MKKKQPCLLAMPFADSELNSEWNCYLCGNNFIPGNSSYIDFGFSFGVHSPVYLVFQEVYSQTPGRLYIVRRSHLLTASADGLWEPSSPTWFYRGCRFFGVFCKEAHVTQQQPLCLHPSLYVHGFSCHILRRLQFKRCKNQEDF